LASTEMAGYGGIMKNEVRQDKLQWNEGAVLIGGYRIPRYVDVVER
jgi:hypothetical protein